MADRDVVLAVFDAAIAARTGVERKGKTMPYTAVGGHMFSFVSKENVLCLRLSKDDKVAFQDGFGGEDVIQYGAVMRGYVTVPEALLSDPTRLAEWFAKAHEYAKSLKPK